MQVIPTPNSGNRAVAGVVTRLMARARGGGRNGKLDCGSSLSARGGPLVPKDLRGVVGDYQCVVLLSPWGTAMLD